MPIDLEKLTKTFEGPCDTSNLFNFLKSRNYKFYGYTYQWKEPDKDFITQYVARKREEVVLLSFTRNGTLIVAMEKKQNKSPEAFYETFTKYLKDFLGAIPDDFEDEEVFPSELSPLRGKKVDLR